MAFVLASLSQPLALDACALSCEAARAAHGPVLAPPCHHTSSCAVQIAPPTTAGSTVSPVALAPSTITIAVPQNVSSLSELASGRTQRFISPPTPLRV